jgi:hypothetical protein
MDILDPATDLVKDGAEEINKTRDYLAQRTSAVTPVAKGGTGATNAAGARSNLGVVWSTSADADTLIMRNANGHSAVPTPVNSAHIASKGYVDLYVGNQIAAIPAPDLSSRVAKSGDTMSGNLFLPASSAATSGWTVCYINADGRVCRGSSSQRYKKYIHDAPDLGDLFAAPLREYQMRADGIVPDDRKKHIGYVAEELVGTDMERFVVVINNQVESIDFIALLMAQVSQLHDRVKALEEAS